MRTAQIRIGLDFGHYICTSECQYMWTVGFMPDQNAVIPLAHCSDAVGEGWETEVSEHAQKKED